MNSNEELVDYMVEQGYIKTEEVEEAFRAVDRKRFVPDSLRDAAYRDRPLPLGGESTISQPSLVAKITELLDVENRSSVIEIGSGSGYQLAVLAQLTDREVVGVEIVPELAQRSRQRLSGLEVDVYTGSGFEPVKDRNFDRILYDAAVKNFQEAREHLHQDGIAVAPVKTGEGQVLKRLKDGKITEHGKVRFVDYREE